MVKEESNRSRWSIMNFGGRLKLISGAVRYGGGRVISSLTMVIELGSVKKLKRTF